MRRRQIYAARAQAAREAAFLQAPIPTPDVLAYAPIPETMVQRISETVEKENYCPKCKRTFRDGRGRTNHMKACKV